MQRLVASLAVLILPLAFPAAASAQTPVPPGRYRFTERVSGTPPMVLEGEIVVEGDSIYVVATWADCLWAQVTSKTRLVYECGRVLIKFDRIDPLNRADYEASVTVTERVEVCEEYTVNASGQRVCARMKRDLVEREVTRTGRLRFRREDSPPDRER
ncbi:MAG TPA: hypothetical protein VF862_13040 [Gemmatimonadales bacterium]